mgnify:CR=1 FL=1
MKKFILMVVAVLGFSFAQAQSVVENYNAATKAVEAKDYAKAAELFESVINEGSEEEDETIAGCVKNAQNNLPVVYTRLGSAAAGAATGAVVPVSAFEPQKLALSTTTSTALRLLPFLSS